MYVAGDETDEELLAQVARWPADPDWCGLDVERLHQVAREKGLDFATALLYYRLIHSAEHGPLYARLSCLPAEPMPLRGVKIVVVPGAFYVEASKSGADGQAILDEARRCGCAAERIHLHSFGKLTDNVATLAQYLRFQDANSLVLVSLSTGSAVVKLALQHPESAMLFRSVRWWIDLSGLCQGTPLSRWLLDRPWRCLFVRCLFWFKGYAFSALRDLERGPQTLLHAPCSLLPWMQAIHVIGIPRQRHLLAGRSPIGYRRLAPQGPNDSIMLLGDCTHLPGRIYPVWGADHYLRPGGEEMRPLVARLLRALAEEIAGSCSTRFGC